MLLTSQHLEMMEYTDPYLSSKDELNIESDSSKDSDYETLISHFFTRDSKFFSIFSSNSLIF